MKVRYLIILVLLISYSCSKEEETRATKKTGHFLSRIISKGYTEEAYYYDKEGNLITIDLFSPTYGINKNYKMEFEYDSNGLVQKWTRIDPNGKIVMYESFEYDNQNRVIKRTGYSLNNSTSKFEANISAKFKYINNRIEIQFYNYGIISPVYFELEYDWLRNNITIMRSYVNGSMTNLTLYAYDNKVNPYYDLKLPLPLNHHNFISEAAYFSKNNVIRENSLIIKPDSAIIDTAFSSSYNLNYQYDILGCPIVLNPGNDNSINFEYIDIE